jgi:glyoxylase I family protein
MSSSSGQARPAAPAVTGYHHLGLTVRDIEASEAWYARVLGLARAFVEPHRGGTGHAVVMTRPGAGWFLGLDHHADADRQLFSARRTGLDHLAFGLPGRADLDAWAARLDALGVEHGPIFEAAEPVPHALAVFRDPDGIPVELIWLGA